MGCRIGYYLVFKRGLTSKDMVPVIKDLFEFILNYEGQVPGADSFSC